jgi:nicotinamidase-related amidase
VGEIAMTERIWDRYLTPRDRKVFAAGGFGKRAGFGHRPAVIVVDVNYNFVGDRPEPILDSIRTWSHSCGEEGWEGVRAIKTLLTAARAKHLPIFYTTHELRDDGLDAGGWAWKNSRTVDDIGLKQKGNQIVAEIAPMRADFVIKKQKASGFFGTALMSFLTDFKVDSVLVVGTSTSGCVHATVVDAVSYNLRCVVVEEGCFDRGEASHALALFNMHGKYADVVGLAEVIRYIETLPSGLFEPAGALAQQVG